MIYLAAALTVCFLALITLICTAKEGHEIVGVGFHEGPNDGCEKCRAFVPPCRSCGIGPCVCGEFDTLPALPGERRLDAREGEPDARPFVAVSAPLHASEVSDA